MIAEDLIDTNIPILSLLDTVDKALLLLEDTGYNLLPVQQDGAFLGFVTEDLLFSIPDSFSPIGKVPLILHDCITRFTEHWYDVAKRAAVHKSSMVAIVDDQRNFLGCVKSEHLLQKFYGISAIKNPGGILVLEVDNKDYSLADVSRIIESNGAKILSAILSDDEHSSNLNYLTIKLNLDDLSRVIAGLERYNYVITGQFHQAEFENLDKQRLDHFFKFLNI